MSVASDCWHGACVALYHVCRALRQELGAEIAWKGAKILLGELLTAAERTQAPYVKLL